MHPVYRLMNLLNFSLLPARCVLCQGAGLPELDLCAACFSAMPTAPKPMPFAYGTVYAGFCYQSPIDELIQGFKFNEQLHFGRFAARLSLPALAQACCAIAQHACNRALRPPSACRTSRVRSLRTGKFPRMWPWSMTCTPPARPAWRPPRHWYMRARSA